MKMKKTLWRQSTSSFSHNGGGRCFPEFCIPVMLSLRTNILLASDSCEYKTLGIEKYRGGGIAAFAISNVTKESVCRVSSQRP